LQLSACRPLDCVQPRLMSPSRRLALLAPPNAFIPDVFTDVGGDCYRHRALFLELQRFRAEVYLKDGAIKQSDLIDGRHVAEADDHSWHLLVRDENGRIAGCIRYQAHDTRSLFLRLSVFSAAIAACPQWGPVLKKAVDSEVTKARNSYLSFVEVGGWALAEHVRGTSEALRLALAAYSLGQLLGGAVGMSTATRRHCSSSIVRRIGGESLKYAGVPIPAYYDPQYQCEMEILRFSSWKPNPRYILWVDEIRQSLEHIPVISSTARALAAAG
jgi:hypothetical protein